MDIGVVVRVCFLKRGDGGGREKFPGNKYPARVSKPCASVSTDTMRESFLKVENTFKSGDQCHLCPPST